MVLFAFLLTLPLQSTFAELSGVDRMVYYVAFASSALAAVLLIAPSVHQRVRAPISGIKRRSMDHVLIASHIALVGTVVFVVAIAWVVYLVTSIVFDSTEAVVATLVVTVVAVSTWFYLPLVTFRGDDGKAETEGEGGWGLWVGGSSVGRGWLCGRGERGGPATL